jgi:hypothetical protein
MKKMYTDDSKKFKTKNIEKILNNKEIELIINNQYTPKHNRIAEFENQPIIEEAESIIYSRFVLFTYEWIEIVSTVSNIINKKISSKVIDKLLIGYIMKK